MEFIVFHFRGLLMTGLKVVVAFDLDQSMISYPIAFVMDISIAVSVKPFGRW
jgi:hypothetical protein